jgi:serum/glucocorticoid-regulated kinase 2
MVTKQPNVDPRLSFDAVSVVRGLLVKNPKARLCCREGEKELRKLPFFASLDWDAVFNKQVRMPYIPELTDAADTSSFETTFTREAPIDSVVDASSESGKNSKKGLLGMFFGTSTASNTTTKVDDDENDAFKDFAFAKNEDVQSTAES